MRNIELLILIGAICHATTGCTGMPTTPAGSSSVSHAVRSDMGRMAIRGPTTPLVSLTTNVDNKGEAAGKTAAAAGVGWLDASMEAASAAEEPFTGSLFLAFGLVTAPIIAAGGAVYGASSADTDEAIEAGNVVIEDVLGSAPGSFRHALETRFSGRIPVAHEFVAVRASDAELLAQGFDSVMDVRLESIASKPSANQFHVWFDTHNRVILRRLDGGRLLETRSYDDASNSRAISAWATANGQTLLTELSTGFAGLAEKIADEFFLAPAIRVTGVEPVARGWLNPGTVSGTVPLFVWKATDGRDRSPGKSVDYEIAIFPRGEIPLQGERIRTARYAPAEPLLACRKYRWKVRAHYDSFGTPATSAWTPEYRFKTPCH